MLRRVVRHDLPLFARQQIRSFSVTSSLLQASGNAGSSGGKKFTNEDQEDLERERRLREQFAQKIHQHTGGPQSSAAGFSQQQQGAPFTPPNLPFYPPGMKWMLKRLEQLQQQQQQRQQKSGFTPNQQQFQQTQGAASAALGPIGQIIFFSISIVMLIALVQLSDPKSLMNVMAGIPWYEAAPDSVACFLLCRALLPLQQQSSIRAAFIQESAGNKNLSFAQFIWQRYPNIFNGTRVSQPQLISGLCAVIASSTNLKSVETAISAGRRLAPSDAVDKIYDELLSANPQAFVQQPPQQQMIMMGNSFSQVAPPPPMMMLQQPVFGQQQQIVPGSSLPMPDESQGMQQYQFSTSMTMNDPSPAQMGSSTMKSDV